MTFKFKEPSHKDGVVMLLRDTANEIENGEDVKIIFVKMHPSLEKCNCGDVHCMGGYDTTTVLHDLTAPQVAKICFDTIKNLKDMRD